jgi:chaperonin GroES
MSAKLTPVGHRVIAKQIETEAKTATGIYLPDAAKDKPELAEVVAVGAEVKDIKKGDKVVYKTYSSPIKIDGVEYLFLSVDHGDKEGDILAVVGK